MRCAWQELLRVIPTWMRADVDRLGKEHLQELRLRLGKPPELILPGGSRWLSRSVTAEDIQYCVNTASRYSPWAASTITKGFITAPGGHRIGLCGDAVIQGGSMTGVRSARSLCIRVARDFPGLARNIPLSQDSVLIIGSPGSGKTTLLRDLIRKCGNTGQGSIAVVDERGELFPDSFDTGQRTDVLTGCGKGQGITMLLRTMSPAWIAVDEITEDADCDALIQAGWCGVRLLATAHASDMPDLIRRPIYRRLVNSGIFQQLIVLRTDKTLRVERMPECT